MTDPDLKQLLGSVRTIAIVGHSDKPWRDSYRIGAYLRAVNYRVFPVNPNVQDVLGQAAFPNLESAPEPIDLVDVFRASEHVAEVVDQAIRVKAKVFWTQYGVYISPADRERLERAGIAVVENRCIKVDHQRLF